MKVKAGVVLPIKGFVFTTGDLDECGWVEWAGFYNSEKSFRVSSCDPHYYKGIDNKEPIELLNILYGG